MNLLKIARTQAGKFNLDDYIDAAGYAAIAGEIAQAREKQRAQKLANYYAYSQRRRRRSPKRPRDWC